MKALIVEDDKILSDTIKQCIEKKYSVEQAYDGYEGYMFAKENIYDIIILDLMMPEMDGYEVLSKLRKNEILTPVLILTAKDSLNDKVKGLNLGADDYLPKPFEREELLARLEALIRLNDPFSSICFNKYLSLSVIYIVYPPFKIIIQKIKEHLLLYIYKLFLDKLSLCAFFLVPLFLFLGAGLGSSFLFSLISFLGDVSSFNFFIICSSRILISLL